MSDSGSQPSTRTTRTYDKISQEKYARVVEALELGRSIGEISSSLNVKVRTIYSIRKRFKSTGTLLPKPRGGFRYRKVHAKHVKCLVAMLEADASLTLKDLKEELMLNHPDVDFGITTISRALDKKLLTLRRISDNADPMQTGENCSLDCPGFPTWFIQMAPSCEMVYLYEASFNLWTRRYFSGHRHERGRAVHRCVQVNLVQAFSSGLGLIYSDTVCQALTEERFRDCFAQVLRSANGACEAVRMPANQRFCLLTDSQLWLKEAVSVVTPQQRTRWSLRLLPPNVGCQSPIDRVHHSLKSAIKAKVASDAVRSELDKPPANISLHDWRLLVLQRIVEESVVETDPDVYLACCSEFQGSMVGTNEII